MTKNRDKIILNIENNKGSLKVFQHPVGTVYKYKYSNQITDSRILKNRNNLREVSPEYVLVIKHISNYESLVAPCSFQAKNKYKRISTKEGDVFVNTDRFFPIDTSSLSLQKIFKVDVARKIIKEVYNYHNSFVNEHIKKKMYFQAEQKKNQKLMESIEKKLGYIPVDRRKQKIIKQIRGKKGSNKKGREYVSYTDINPKPYYGGTFTPK